MENNNENNRINIELPEDIATGVYSNLAVLTHSQTEFICDFIQIMPGVPKARVRSRVIMTGEDAKSLLYAVQDNIRKYDENLGKIKERHQDLPPINFATPPTAASTL